MFKRCYILRRESDYYDFNFPENEPKLQVKEKPFIFPCLDFEKYDQGIYVVVLTELSGDRSFIVVKYDHLTKCCIAIESVHAWFEILFEVINIITSFDLHTSYRRNELRKYLKELQVIPSLQEGLTVYIPPPISLTVEYSILAKKFIVPNKLRQKPYLMFLQCLRKQIVLYDWIILFESLLLEKWIVFHSRHLNRVSSCIFAALSLIFPLEWVHLIFPCLSEQSINCLGCPSPFLAGIHTCLLDRVLPLLSPGTLVVNIDEGVLQFVSNDNGNIAENSNVIIDSDIDDHRIPKPLMNFLSRSLEDGDSKLQSIKKHDKKNEQESQGFKLILNGFLNTLAVLLGKYKSCSLFKVDKSRYGINTEMMAASQGDSMQPFLSRILQSQMVYQFLDERLNQPARVPDKQHLKFATDEMDDFEEACQSMSRWQPDHYLEVFANMASRSRRTFNDFAVRVRDIGKKNSSGSELRTVASMPRMSSSSGTPPLCSAMVSSTTRSPITIGDSPVISHKQLEIESSPATRTKWITFDDDNDAHHPISDNVFENSDDAIDLVSFEGPKVFFSVHGKNPEKEKQSTVPTIIRDFDPLFQN